MALLASCWLILETFLIPHGFLKWFFLSFYMHPFFLVFCQIFLWLKEFQRWILLLLSFPLKIVFLVSLFIFRLINGVATIFFSFTRQTKVEDLVEVAAVSCSLPCQIKNRPSIQSKVYLNYLDTCSKESWLDEYLSSDHFTTSFLTYDLDTDDSIFSTENSSSSFCSSPADQDADFSSFSELENSPSIYQELIVHEPNYHEDFEISSSQSCDQLLIDHEYLAPTCSSNSLVNDLEQQLIISTSVQEDHKDPFQQKYRERVGFFDLLYHERLHGMNAILNERPTITESSADPSRKRILRSLESDFELIYVAQLCLFWEALNHQYLKVEALITTSSDDSEISLFHHSLAGKFQELQILLERFVENQKLETQTSSNNIHKRLSFQCLLLVPDVTGFMEDENNGIGESVDGTQILKGIENCIEAFYLYIQTDDKKSQWKYKGIWRTHPPVEDPLGLEILHNVSRTLHKKEMMLKDLQRKKKYSLRKKLRSFLTKDDKRRNFVFAMVEMKLVQRLLKMSIISKSQLKWCQDKLNNLELERGNVFRVPTSDHLFPSF